MEIVLDRKLLYHAWQYMGPNTLTFTPKSNGVMKSLPSPNKIILTTSPFPRMQPHIKGKRPKCSLQKLEQPVGGDILIVFVAL